MFILLILEVLVAAFVLLVTAYFAYWVYFNNHHYWVDKNVKYHKSRPLVGAFSDAFKKSLRGIDQELYQKYGKLFGVYDGRHPLLFVAEPELLKLIFVKDFNLFPNRREFKMHIPLMDNMVSLVTGEKWKNIRNTMTPAFSSGKLRNMIPTISDCATITTNNFLKYGDKEQSLNCKKLYGNFTLDVIANVAFGTRLDSYNDPDNKFVAHASKFFGTEISYKAVFAVIFPKLGKLLGCTFFPLDSVEFFKDITCSIIRRRELNNEVRADFLQMMIESQKIEEPKISVNDANGGAKANVEKVEQIKRKPLTEDEALSQCVTFFVGGYDSTATTLTALSYYLAVNPDVQEKVLEEVDRIWENRDKLDSEALFEAKYIEAVIDETLRLCPPVIRLERRVEMDCALGDTGIPLKKGMMVAIPVYAMHHDPEFFPEPEEFRPERFLPKDNNQVKPYTYLPFGAGPRNCVAIRLAIMEVKICLLHVLKRVKFSTCPETKIPIEFHRATPLLQPLDVILKVISRS